MMPRTRPLAERFADKVNKNGPQMPSMSTPCWMWTGAKRDGYGNIKIGTFAEGAHRAAWLLVHGSIRDGLHVLHRCDNRLCVRIDHLFLGTNADNVRDKVQKGRARGPTPERHNSRTKPETVLRGEGHPNSKLSDAQIDEIRRRYSAGGVYQYELAAEYGVTQAAISDWVRGNLRRKQSPTLFGVAP